MLNAMVQYLAIIKVVVLVLKKYFRKSFYFSDAYLLTPDPT